MLRFFENHAPRILLIAVISLAFACGHTDEKSKLLARRWAYVEFKLNDELMTGDELDHPVMDFTLDGKYKVEFGEMSEEGTWKMEKDELVTTSANNKVNRLKILELTDQKMVLHSDVEGNKAYITLAPEEAAN